MTRYVFTQRPDTVSVSRIKSRYLVYINIQVHELDAEDIEAMPNVSDEYKFESTGERLMLDELTIQCLLDNIDHDMFVNMGSDEMTAILEAFGVEDDIESWKALRIAQVHAYDSSCFVNNFILNDEEGWLDKNTRVGLVNMYQMSETWNGALPEIWIGDVAISANSASDALRVLGQIEQYAAQCYGVTQRHLAEINRLAANNDIGGLKEFDCTKEYPDNPVLTL